MALRVVFMGTPEFSVPTLQAIIKAGHDVVACYTRAPKPAGRRGLTLTKSPVHDVAEANQIPVFTPRTLRDEGEQTRFASHDADVAVVVAYGLICPNPFWTRRVSAVSICTGLCCRAGAAPRPFSGRSWRAIKRLASWSCAWKRVSTPAPWR